MCPFEVLYDFFQHGCAVHETHEHTIVSEQDVKQTYALLPWCCYYYYSPDLQIDSLRFRLFESTRQHTLDCAALHGCVFGYGKGVAFFGD